MPWLQLHFGGTNLVGRAEPLVLDPAPQQNEQKITEAAALRLQITQKFPAEQIGKKPLGVILSILMAASHPSKPGIHRLPIGQCEAFHRLKGCLRLPMLCGKDEGPSGLRKRLQTHE